MLINFSIPPLQFYFPIIFKIDFYFIIFNILLKANNRSSFSHIIILALISKWLYQSLLFVKVGGKSRVRRLKMKRKVIEIKVCTKASVAIAKNLIEI